MLSSALQEKCQTASLETYVDKYPMFVDYDKSILFDFSSKSDKVNGLKEVCQTLYDKIFPADRTVWKVKDKIRATELIVANLIKAAALNKVLAVNLNRSFYSRLFSYPAFIKVLKGLQSEHYVQTQNGFHGKGRSKVTRIWMSLKLRTLLSDNGILPSAIPELLQYRSDRNFIADKQILELRDSVIAIPENVHTISMRQFLERYNSQVQGHHLTLPMYDLSQSGAVSMYTPNGISELHQISYDYHFLNTIEQLMPQTFHLEDYNLVWDSDYFNFSNSTIAYDWTTIQSNQSSSSNINNIAGGSYSFCTITKSDLGKLQIERKLSTKLHRVFNIDMTQGGRFYGAGYQQIKKGFRQHLKIDDKPTIERDFSALHPRMLYHKKIGITYKADPYKVVCKLLNSDSDDMRSIVKIVLNAMLNAGSEKGAIKGINHSLFKNSQHWTLKSKHLEIEDIIDAVYDSHPRLEDHFFQSRGLELMGYDSTIAEEVLKHFCKQDVLCLCMHDSFIVQKQYEQELLQVMRESYKMVIGNYECQIK